MADIYDNFLNSISVDALLRRGMGMADVQPPMQLPPEYMDERPDLLGMEVQNFLEQTSPIPNPPQPIVQSPKTAASPWNPKGNSAPPVVGRDIGLDDLTKILRQRESSGNYTALNKERPGNTASGAYQYTDSTWNGYGGYAKAMLAPPEVQDRRFAEDLSRRFKRYGGDPFKMIAEHYLPALASDPGRWTQPYKTRNGQVVKPVASYVQYVVKGTPLEAKFNEYMARHQ